VAGGTAYHQWWRESIAANDIRFAATLEGRPVRLRGVIDSEPIQSDGTSIGPLRPFTAKSSMRFAFRVNQLEHRGDWYTVSGSLQVTAVGKRNRFHVGDEVDLRGMLSLPIAANNPGEFDYGEFLRDRGIGATLAVPDAAGAAELLREGWPRSFQGWLAELRGRAVRTLDEYVPEQRRIAAALLVGYAADMTDEDWERYLHTGVIHVLAISGQHLLIVGNFLWVMSRLLRLPRRPAALLIAILLLGYALMTGASPPIMRAAWMAIAFTIAIFLRRLVLPSNSLALAWIGVILAAPTCIFETGCQLSFIAVGLMILGTYQLSFFTQNLMTLFSKQEQHAPALEKLIEQSRALEKLIDESRSPTGRFFRRVSWTVAAIYLESALIWLALTPLIASRYHLMSPIALVIGPPVVLLSSIALLSGLGVLVTAPIFTPLAVVFGWLTKWNLATCETLVDAARRLPGAFSYVPDVPGWWLVVFYGGLLVWIAFPMVRQWFRLGASAGLGWTCFGCAILFWPPDHRQFRCTFLAVGHGGCTVIETPGNRVILYDAGAINGPDVTRRQIAPFLWSRGYRRIDEIIVSHGDLDHFNGVPGLLERFAVGQVILTPSFADHTTPGISYTLRTLTRMGLKHRVIHAPTTWETDGIAFEVLHPPARGPEGIENVRSLVLHVRYEGLSMLLTGDLEEPGLTRVVSSPARPVDVLMAPHHGSPTSNTKELAAWARPKFVVSCQGAPKSTVREPNPYEAIGARWLSTWSQGAVTVRRDGAAWTVETFATGNRWPVVQE
jgi:competence protein ComEC